MVTAMTNNRTTLLPSFICAALFVLFPWALGWGLIVSIVSGLNGAIAGFCFVDQSQRYMDSDTREGVEQFLRGIRPASRLSELKLLNDRGGLGKTLGLISIGFSFKSPYQRVASYSFLVQAVLGALAICVFLLAEAPGVDLDILKNQEAAKWFADAFTSASVSAIARYRFVYLFVPLAGLFIGPMAALGLSYLASIPSSLRKGRRYIPAMLLAPMLTLGLWAFFTHTNSMGRGFQFQIVRGDLWGYVTIFVLGPAVFAVVAGFLPSSRACSDIRSGEIDGNG